MTKVTVRQMPVTDEKIREATVLMKAELFSLEEYEVAGLDRAFRTH